MASLNQFLAAIRQVESSGRYGVVNSIGATGAYQVMPANIGPWTAKWYGERLSQEEFRRNKSAQDAVARGQLGEYVRKYGYRGAAQAWYGGPGGVGKSYTAGYANKVMGLVGSVPAVGGGGGQSSGNFERSERVDMKTLAEQYGFAAAFFKSSKELTHLIENATAGQWSPDKFQAQLRGTKWYRKHTDSQRKWIALQTGDPATAQRQMKTTGYHITRMAAQLGVKLSSKDIQNLALQANEYGFEEQTLQYAIAAHWVWDKNKGFQGAAANTADQIKEVYGNYGVPFSDKSVADQTKRILTGMGTLDDVMEQARNNAKNRFPGISEQIDQGATVRDIASPYMDMMSNVLEINPDSINFADDRLVSNALSYRDPRSGDEFQTMPLFQFEDQLRADPRWRRTNNAMDSAMSLATSLLSSMGLMA